MDATAAAAAAGCGGDELLLSLLESPQPKPAAVSAPGGGGAPGAAADRPSPTEETGAPTLADGDAFGHEDAMKEAVGATASLNGVGGGHEQQHGGAAAPAGGQDLFGDEMNHPYWQELMSNLEMDCDSLDFLSGMPMPSLPPLAAPEGGQMDFGGADGAGAVELPAHYHKQQSMPTTRKEADARRQQHQHAPQRISSEPALVSPYDFPDVFDGSALSVDDIRSYPGRAEHEMHGDPAMMMAMASAHGVAPAQQQELLEKTPRRNFTMERSLASSGGGGGGRQRRPQKLTWVQKQELYMRKHGMLTNYNGNTSLDNLTDISGINITDLDSPVFVSSDKVITPSRQRSAPPARGAGAGRAGAARGGGARGAKGGKVPGAPNDGFTGFVKSGVLASVALVDCGDGDAPTVNAIVRSNPDRAPAAARRAAGKSKKAAEAAEGGRAADALCLQVRGSSRAAGAAPLRPASPPLTPPPQHDQGVKYHGISRQKWSARWDAHVVDMKSDTTMYLGSFDAREKAARAHDVAFLKLNGPAVGDPGEMDSKLNFPASDYADLKGTRPRPRRTRPRRPLSSLTALTVRAGIADVSADAIMAALRRESEDGSAMKASKFRGVYRSDNGSEWEARLAHDSPLVPYRSAPPTAARAKRDERPKKGIHPLPAADRPAL